MTTPEPLTDQELAELEELAAAATPGPWFARLLDDDWAMQLVAVSTTPDTGHGERYPTYDSGKIVAATLVQHPGYVLPDGDLCHENAYFIAAARQGVPRLIAEVRRLRAQLAR